MYLSEMFGTAGDEGAGDVETGDLNYRNEEDDNTVIKMSDLRKTRLTLKHIKKLRNMHDARKHEQNSRLVSLKKQYKSPDEEGVDPGGF